MKIRFTDYVSEIWLPDCFKLAINEKNDNDATISRNDVIVKFFDVLLFLLLNLITGPCLMSISLLVLELWQFSFIRSWPEIWKMEIPPSEFCPISEDWGKLGIPNLAWMFLECCKMSGLQPLLLPFYFYRGVKLLPPPPRLGLINYILIYMTRGYDTNGNKKWIGKQKL